MASIEKRAQNGHVRWYMRYRRALVAHHPVVLHGHREDEQEDPVQVRRLNRGQESLGVNLAVDRLVSLSVGRVGRASPCATAAQRVHLPRKQGSPSVRKGSVQGSIEDRRAARGAMPQVERAHEDGLMRIELEIGEPGNIVRGLAAAEVGIDENVVK